MKHFRLLLLSSAFAFSLASCTTDNDPDPAPSDDAAISFAFDGSSSPGASTNVNYGTNRHGGEDSAAMFNGIDSYVEASGSNSNLAFGSNKSFTTSAWIKAGAGQPDFAGIISKGTQVSLHGFQMTLWDDRLNFQLEAENGVFDLTGDTRLTDNQWHHVAVTVDRTTSTVKFWVDGQLELQQESFAVMGDVTTSSPVLVGVDRNMVRWFHGSIDEARIYGKALTADEIRALANN